MLAKSKEFRQYSTMIYFQNHLQQKVLDGFDSNKVSENYTVKGDKILNIENLCRKNP